VIGGSAGIAGAKHGTILISLSLLKLSDFVDRLPSFGHLTRLPPSRKLRRDTSAYLPYCLFRSPLVTNHLSLITNHRFTSVSGDDGVPGVSLLAIGYWLSAIGYRLSAIGYQF